MMKVTVLGAGAWGTALGHLAQRRGHAVTLWSRQSGLALADALAHADLIISAIAMRGVRSVATQVQAVAIPPHAILVTATKGLDALATQTPSQIWQEALPDHAVVVLSGPNLSKEINQGLPAATVVASQDPEAATAVQTALASERFRIYTNPDPRGTELGGALKNVIAIAVGVCEGLHLGDNAKAGLITRALPELIRVGMTLGAQAETFFGLSGLGDLLATCNSPLSRNYQVGYQLAQGKTLDQVLQDLEGTAEGINTAQVLVQIAQRESLSIPVSLQVYRLLQQEVTPYQALEALMERDLKAEQLMFYTTLN